MKARLDNLKNVKVNEKFFFNNHSVLGGVVKKVNKNLFQYTPNNYITTADIKELFEKDTKNIMVTVIEENLKRYRITVGLNPIGTASEIILVDTEDQLYEELENFVEKCFYDWSDLIEEWLAEVDILDFAESYYREHVIERIEEIG